MPKYKLEFDIPDEEEEFRLAAHSKDIWAVLWEVAEDMRLHLKHGYYEFNSPQEAVEFYHKMIHEKLTDLTGVEF